MFKAHTTENEGSICRIHNGPGTTDGLPNRSGWISYPALRRAGISIHSLRKAFIDRYPHYAKTMYPLLWKDRAKSEWRSDVNNGLYPALRDLSWPPASLSVEDADENLSSQSQSQGKTSRKRKRKGKSTAEDQTDYCDESQNKNDKTNKNGKADGNADSELKPNVNNVAVKKRKPNPDPAFRPVQDEEADSDESAQEQARKRHMTRSSVARQSSSPPTTPRDTLRP